VIKSLFCETQHASGIAKKSFFYLMLIKNSILALWACNSPKSFLTGWIVSLFNQQLKMFETTNPSFYPCWFSCSSSSRMNSKLTSSFSYDIRTNVYFLLFLGSLSSYPSESFALMSLKFTMGTCDSCEMLCSSFALASE